MKELQDSLVKLMNAASVFRKVNAEVADQRIFTREYLRRIHAGELEIKDKPENREKVHKLIDLYTEKIIERTREIEKCLQPN